MISRLFPLIVLMLLSNAQAFSAPGRDRLAELEPATQALSRGDYKKAYAGFARHAARNPLAQFNLALMEQNGWGRPANERKACRWFEKAAKGKIPAAQHFFGVCLVKGVDRPVDVPAAIQWFQQAADRGHLISLCTAGELYINGIGIARDARQGLELCTQAARKEVPLAMLRLADYYRAGKDVPQDLPAARYWYAQAAERHLHEAQYHLGVMLSEGQGGEPDLPAALFWLETAAGEGYAPAYLPTAILYANAGTQPETGMLAPEHLAKIYVWLMAAKKTAGNAAEQEEILKIEKMVLQVMPASWRDQLDKQVGEHLAAFSRKK